MDMYDLAIVSYALSRAGSGIAYVVYRKLEKFATKTKGNVTLGYYLVGLLRFINKLKVIFSRFFYILANKK